MNHLSNFSLRRTSIISFLGLGGLIFGMAFMSSSYQVLDYKSLDSKISFSSLNMEDYSTFEASNLDCKATLIFESEQLTNVSSFSFSVPSTEIKFRNKELEASMQQQLMSKDGKAINFIQKHVMVLSTMKMVHSIGEISIGKISQPISFQLVYEYNENKELILSGKQSVRLSDFGIAVPQHMSSEIKNELNLIINIKMVEDKQANNFNFSIL